MRCFEYVVVEVENGELECGYHLFHLFVHHRQFVCLTVCSWLVIFKLISEIGKRRQ